MTTTTNIKNYTFPDSKPHYMILDGLRGVAALLVVLFHVFECFDWSPAPHGYLAVDFFFVLSGFVIGYAYDDRWKPADETKRPRLTMGGFFLRRLIRLHPMVVAGAVFGAVCFLLQGSVRWDGTPVGIGWGMLAMLLGMFMLPLYPGAHADVRGNGELFPLNGPNWSLFFEYIGNVLYALLLRRLPTRWLAMLTIAMACMLTAVALHDGYLGVGWSMADGGLWTGMVRMLFPYSTGMLMAREFRPCKVRHTFWLCSLVIVAVGCLPLLWGEMSPLANGLYDALCVVFVFPLLVWMGASELTTDATTTRVSTILGNLSYPLYAVHYPLMYLFYAHIGFHGDLVPISKLADVWHVAIALPVACIVLGWLFFRYYDLPLRRWLSKTYIK
jgi:peptidoglycan/LPS O-acetylase OafA/YrhL